MSGEEDESQLLSPNPQRANDPSFSELLTDKRIVICEDEGVTQLQLSRLLKKAGLIVAGAVNNGKSGVETVLRERPDLVLMDGLQATEQTMAQYPVCVVMLTAFADNESRARAEELGCAGYLIEPVTGAMLIRTLEQSYRGFQER